MKSPLVSVCIPTFNGEKYIADALRSVHQQSYQPLEIIVSDDDSKDLTLEIINDFKKETEIPINIYHHEPSGIGANWNNCMLHANGKYIKFLFQDDVLKPTCVEEMVNILQRDDSVALVACKRNFLIEENARNENTFEWIKRFEDLQKGVIRNENPNELHSNIILNKSSFKNPAFFKPPFNKIGEPSAVMFRKSIIDKVGLFRTDMFQSLDYEFWYRILRNYKILILDKSLAYFRIHQDQATIINRKMKNNDYLLLDKILRKEYFFLLHPKKQFFLLIQYNMMKRLASKIKRVIAKTILL